jgi:UDP-N-acetylmuramate dehydrogenase
MTATANTAYRHALDSVANTLPRDDMAYDVPLSMLSRWRIGGPADLVVTPSTPEALARALVAIAETGLPHAIIGDGSNMLFDDAGFRGVIVRMGRRLGGVSIETEGQAGGTVKAGAGHWAPCVVRRTLSAGLSGLVHAIGIPGTLGGLVAMNGGSQRKGVGEHLVSAQVVDFNGHFSQLDPAALDFAYRRSRLLDGGLVLLSAVFRLPRGDPRALRQEAIAIMRERREKFPDIRANCGSVFVSDPELYSRIGPPGFAIEQVGLKGHRHGGAQISPQHANFIVNLGDARATDILTLIALARRQVFNQTGVALKAEVRHLGASGQLRPAHEVADDIDLSQIALSVGAAP